ncbi:hypothetical protein PR048_032898 [Dryococelus australis]|uniref:Uncharacterized protein n=1 Tax=Dryococelus australis TaxID=614101 RepID=A0ABQ9G3I8_9NEOP|nr:hypothetical protein PR048_032898 [Dryococelus australis]
MLEMSPDCLNGGAWSDHCTITTRYISYKHNYPVLAGYKRLMKDIRSKFRGLRPNGGPELVLAYTVSLALEGIPAKLSLDLPNVVRGGDVLQKATPDGEVATTRVDLRRNSSVLWAEGTAVGLRNRSPSKMTKYVECWGADKPFANITESTLAKNIGLTVSTQRSSAPGLLVVASFFRSHHTHTHSPPVLPPILVPMTTTFPTEITTPNKFSCTVPICMHSNLLMSLDKTTNDDEPSVFCSQSISMIETNLLPGDNACLECRGWRKSEELNPVSLWFRKRQQEADYRDQPDPHFRRYVTYAFLLFLCVAAIQMLTVPRTVALWVSFGSAGAALLLLLYLCWLEGRCPAGLQSDTPREDNCACAGHVVSSSRWLRLSIFLLSASLVACCAVITLVRALTSRRHRPRSQIG